MASSGIQAFGSAFQGEAEKKSSYFNATVAEQNAAISRDQSIEAARRERVQARKTIGDMRANFAASGVGLSGSALDILGESAANAELDSLTTLHSGETKARMFESEAKQLRAYGRAAKTGGYIAASGHLLEGATKAVAGGAG